MTIYRRITDRDIHEQFARFRRLLVQAGVPQEEADRTKLQLRDIQTYGGKSRESYAITLRSATTEIGSFVDGLDDLGTGREAYRSLLAVNAGLAIGFRQAVY